MQTKASLTLTEQDIRDKFLGNNTSQQMQGKKSKYKTFNMAKKIKTL